MQAAASSSEQRLAHTSKAGKRQSASGSAWPALAEMSRRGIETALAYWTLLILIVYVPLETWTSWPGGLLNPFYVVDAIAMALLSWGAIHSLRSRPAPSPEILCIGAAWACANAWRATFGSSTRTTVWRDTHIWRCRDVAGRRRDSNRAHRIGGASRSRGDESARRGQSVTSAL